MARPIKMHEDTLFKVMQKSLKPLEASMSKVSIALQTQSVESKIEGKRAEKITQDNEIKQTNLLNDIATSFKYERKILQAGFKGMKSIAAMPMKVGGFIKDHWGKLGLVGIGTALATMDAKDWMNLINSLRDGLKTVKENWPKWQKNIQSKEWWEKQAEKLEKFGNKMGGYIMDGIKMWLTGKAVLSLGAAFAKYLAPAIVTALVTKKVLKDAIKNSGLTPTPTDKPDLKDTKKKTSIWKKLTEKSSKGLQAAKRVVPIIAGGRVVGYAGVVAGVAALGNAFQKALNLTQDDSPELSKEEIAKKAKEQKNLASRTGNSFAKNWLTDVGGKGGFFDLVTETTKFFVADASSLLVGTSETNKAKIDKVTGEFGDTLVDGLKTMYKETGNAYRSTSNWFSDRIKQFKNPNTADATSGGGSTFRNKTTHPGGKDDKFVPKNSDPINRMQADGNEPGLWDKTKSLLGFGKPSKTSGADQHIFGGTTPTSAIKYSSIFNDKNEKPNMSKVAWDLLGGRTTVSSKILKAWNSFGGLPQPYFTSGYRDEDHPLSKKNKNSTHITGTAIDIKSKHLPEHMKGAVYTALENELINKGDFTWGHDHLAGFGDHFHFQRRVAPIAKEMAKGGIVKGGRGGGVFIVGESGQDELVMPLPGNSPHQRMAMLNSIYSERAMSTSGGSSPVNLITSSNSTSSSNNTVPVFTPQVRGKQYV